MSTLDGTPHVGSTGSALVSPFGPFIGVYTDANGVVKDFRIHGLKANYSVYPLLFFIILRPYCMSGDRYSLWLIYPSDSYRGQSAAKRDSSIVNHYLMNPTNYDNTGITVELLERLSVPFLAGHEE